MLRVVRSLIIPLLILAVGCSRDPQTQAKRLVDSGNKFYDRGKFKEASMQYRRAIQKFPKYEQAYYKLGLTSLKISDLPTAAQSFRRSLDLQPNNTDAATKLADIYWLAYISDPQKFKMLKPEIEELAGNLLKKDPNSFDGLRFTGYLALVNNDAEGALAKFNAANKVKPYQPELSLVLMQTLIASKKTDEAERFAKDFLVHEKTYAPIYDRLLMIYLTTNRAAEGEQLLKQKIDANPKQQGYYLQLATFYLALNRNPEAESALKRLTDDPKDFPMARLAIGRLFFRFKNFDRARREYDEGVKSNSTEKALYQKSIAELLVAQNKNQEARAILDDVIKADGKDAQALEMRSALKLQTGNPTEVQSAVNELQSLVTKNPENPIYRFELGRALMVKGSVDQARVQFEESIRMRPDYSAPKILLGQLYTQKGDFSKSLQLADDVLRTESNNLTAHLLRSSALIGLGERDKAKAELDTILKAQPNLADAKFQLGLVNYGEKNFKEADAIFREMETSNPNDNRGLMGVLETQVAQKQYDLAIVAVENQLKRDPNRQDFRLALANVQVRAERYDDAIANFKQLVDKNNKSSDLQIKLGETYRLKGDLNAAIDSFRKANQLAPNDTLPLIRMAMLLDGLGRRGEAKPLYEQILRLKPDEAVALNNLAYIKAEEGTDLDAALSLAQRAKQAMPLDPNIADTLGWVYIKKNLSDDAVRVFRDLVAKVPKSPTLRYHLAMALFQKGDRPSARKECELALQNNPSKEEAAKIRELLQKAN